MDRSGKLQFYFKELNTLYNPKVKGPPKKKTLKKNYSYCNLVMNAQPKGWKEGELSKKCQICVNRRE